MNCFKEANSRNAEAGFSRAPIPKAKFIHPPCAPAPRRPARKRRLEFRPRIKSPRHKRNGRPAALIARCFSKISARVAIGDLFPMAGLVRIFYQPCAQKDFWQRETF